MIGTIPIGDDAQRARVEKLKTMTTAKIAPVAVALCAPRVEGHRPNFWGAK